MSAPPLVAPPEAQPQPADSGSDSEVRGFDVMARPFRLGVVGLGVALGLFTRLAAANDYGDLNSRTLMAAAAATSALVGLGLLLIAAERDRFGVPLAWISTITALSWGTLNWISPPFADAVTIFSRPDQAVLALVGAGNGLLVAGLISLAFVRRLPTLSVAATMLAGVLTFTANTLLLRNEWGAIVSIGVSFALILLAWDRAPRQERTYAMPDAPPRISRAALSLVSVALCGTAIQLWLSRTSIPRSVPAVVLAGVLILAAFGSLIRVRREIEQRETTLSEWSSWFREVRTSDFRAEMESFESSTAPAPSDADGGQPPRKLSFPDLIVPDWPEIGNESDEGVDLTAIFAEDLAATSVPPLPSADVVNAQAETPPVVAIPSVGLVADVVGEAPQPAAPHRTTGATAPPSASPPSSAPSPVAAAHQPGAFSTILGEAAPVGGNAAASVQIANLDALGTWLGSPEAAARVKPLIIAVEAMSLDEFESLPADDAAMATDEIGSYLADIMPDADLVAWIDGPYFMVAHASKGDGELLPLNKSIRKSLKATNGTLAFLRPGPDSSLDELVDEAVAALLQARRAEDRAAGR